MENETNTTNERTILVPLDDSRITKELVKVAIDCRDRTGGKLHFLHIVTSEEMAPHTKYQAFARFMENVQGIPNCESLCRTGTSYSEILEVAQEIQPNLIIMGAHNHSMLGRMFLGSNTDYVTHHCSCPVFVYKHPQTVFANKIIVPIDYTPVNKPVIAHADEWAQQTGAELIFIHATPPLQQEPISGIDTNLTPHLVSQIQQSQSQALHESSQRHEILLKRFVEECQVQSGYQCVSCIGKPYETILMVQEEYNAGLIMMASHDHNLVDRILKGSNTDYLLHHASCPMYVYKTLPA